MRILVTGANGFVGRPLCAWLRQGGHDVIGAVRNGDAERGVGFSVPTVSVGDIHSATDWKAALQDVDAVIHLAARVHVMSKQGASDEEAFIEVNARGTENLARQAAAAGVRRFVFLSTIKVNGEATHGTPFREADMPNPSDAYSRSKWMAEQSLQRIGEETGLEVVFVRPPLMYGPGVKGNFLSLLKAISRAYPLPLASIRNRRSLLSVEQLAKLLELCATRAEAAGQLFLAADTPSISTAELARALGATLKRPARLIPLPVALLEMVGAATGQRSRIQRLIGDLEIDSSKAVQLLDWRNQVELEVSLIGTADWFAARSADSEKKKSFA